MEVLKLLSKPASWDGSTSTWKDWSFTFGAYIRAIDSDLAEGIAQARKATSEIKLKDLSQDEQQRSGLLFSLLVQLWKNMPWSLCRWWRMEMATRQSDESR